jgi:hypothetical protein
MHHRYRTLDATKPIEWEFNDQRRMRGLCSSSASLHRITLAVVRRSMHERDANEEVTEKAEEAGY